MGDRITISQASNMLRTLCNPVSKYIKGLDIKNIAKHDIENDLLGLFLDVWEKQGFIFNGVKKSK